MLDRQQPTINQVFFAGNALAPALARLCAGGKPSPFLIPQVVSCSTALIVCVADPEALNV